MKKYTPEELKNYHQRKYDNWKFAENSKGEWVGVYKNSSGTIVSKVDLNGNEYPDLEIRELTSTGGVGVYYWWQALKNTQKSFSKAPKEEDGK